MVYHPLIFKTATFALKPIGWRGSQAHPLEKQPLPPAAAHFREINLEDKAPTRYGSLMRPQLKDACSNICRETQFGSGLNNGNTQMAHLLLRAQMHLAEVTSMCGVCLFVDASTTYASVPRCLIAQDTNSQVILKAKLLNANVADERWTARSRKWRTLAFGMARALQSTFGYC